jgi:hypothetical protein
MQRNWFLLAVWAMFAALRSGAPGSAAEPDPRGIEFFEQKIRPVLAEHCYQCHSSAAQKAKKLRGGLALDSKSGLLKGGDSGPAVVPGKAKESLLLRALRRSGDLKMPPSGKLPDAVVADFEAWVTMGAPDPRDGAPVTQLTAIDWEKARQSWAFQPPRIHAPPKVRDPQWPKKESDFFILAELEKRGLKPVRPASKRELIRRATFDLTGLPPTPEEVDAFVKDESADAFAKVVDGLLQSPHYGERWGRYWLDVARYADDQALAFTTPSPHAHRYRDWVIRAFNKDMPYDRFLRLQLAGDLLSEPATDYVERLAGLGFQGLGAKYHRGSVAAQVIADELDDRIDTLTRGLLGLTVACARCHDHKYDPIPTRDYYSLAAAYHGAAWTDVPLAAPQTVARFQTWQRETKEKQARLAQWLEERGRAAGKVALADVSNYLLTAWRIVALRRHKVAHDEAVLARPGKLQPYFLKKLVADLETSKPGKVPLLQTWRTTAQKAAALARPRQSEGGLVPVPPDLLKATDDLEREVRSALRELGRLEQVQPIGKKTTPLQSLPAPQQALLRACWLDPGAPFAAAAKDIPALLTASERKQHEIIVAELKRHTQAGPVSPALAHGVSGGGKAMPVYQRGNVERPGEIAPPGFLRILQRKGDTAARQQFTRLDLADAIATAENPLTARVFVNRVWHYHFGRGIVATPSNFGKLGEKPTHPELLDTLAVRFVESGWSVQRLHREIMLSAAYQLSSASDPQNAVQDPDNHWVWRMPPHRLDVEAWRDALLAVAGRLDHTVGGPSLELSDAKNVRRTVYAKVSRYLPSTMLALFDFPDANVTSDRRGVTTVPQQQLFVLNSDLMIGSAKAFAARLARAVAHDEERIVLAFQLAYGRLPTTAERNLGLEFLRTAAPPRPTDRLTPWEQYAQALLATNEFAWVE